MASLFTFALHAPVSFARLVNSFRDMPLSSCVSNVIVSMVVLALPENRKGEWWYLQGMMKSKMSWRR
jgi:hypothetical protein